MQGAVDTRGPGAGATFGDRQPDEAPPPGIGFARTLQVVLVVLIAGFAFTTLPGVRPRPGFVVPIDGWLQGLVYVVCAVLALARPVVSRVHRITCAVLAAAIVLRALGFVLFLAVIRPLGPAQPYPSVADAAWVGSALMLLATLGLRLRHHAPRVSLVLVLDAITGALVTAGLAVMVLLPLLEGMSPRGAPRAAVATNLAYPILDVAILGVAAALLVVCRARPDRPDVALVVGVTLFAVGDCVYLYLLSSGSFAPGSWIAPLSMLATAVLASAGWVRPRRGWRAASVPQSPTLSLPVVFAFLSISGMVVAELVDTRDQPVPQTAVIVLALALVTAIGRTVLSVSSERAVASELLDTASDDVRRFQSLVEASPDFIAMADLQGRLIYMNPAGRRMVGLPDDVDVRTTTIAMYLTEAGNRRLVETTRPAIAQQGYWSGESRLKNLSGGPETPVAVNTFRIDDTTQDRPVAMASIQRDISDRLRAETALRELADERQRLLARLVQAQEDERARIAADVHDDSVQALAAVELRLGLLKRQLGDVDADVRATMEKTHASVVDATARLRELLFDLESPAVGVDLVGALTTAAEHVFEDVDTRWEVSGDPHDDLTEAARVTAYRIVKEALVNVRKHAHATRVDIVVAHDDDGHLVTVRDDGTGFDAEDVHVYESRPGHLGLASMHDRAIVAGGSVHIVSDRTGTEVRLRLPDLAAPGSDPQYLR